MNFITHASPLRRGVLPLQGPQRRRHPQRPACMNTILYIRRRTRGLTRNPSLNVRSIITDPTLTRLRQIRRRIIKSCVDTAADTGPDNHSADKWGHCSENRVHRRVLHPTCLVMSSRLATYCRGLHSLRGSGRVPNSKVFGVLLPTLLPEFRHGVVGEVVVVARCFLHISMSQQL